MRSQGSSTLSTPAPKAGKPQSAAPPETYEPSEESVGIRLVAFLMATLCICVGAAFVNTEIYLTLLYIIFAIGGSYLSYVYRVHKNNWQNKVVIAGILLVAINCWRELGAGLELGDFSMYVPVVHFVAGTFVVQTFELRTRSDINTSQLIGLLLLCIVAPIAKSIFFGGCTLVYITLGAILLYYDCLSRTAQSWIIKPIKQIRLEPTHLVKPKLIHSSPAFAIAILPLATIVLFFLLPRADGLIDSVTAYVRSLGARNNEMVMQMPPLPADQKPIKWKPREKKTNSKTNSKNVAAKGEPENPGAHDGETKAKGGQKTGKPGAPEPKDKKRPDKQKEKRQEKDKSKAVEGNDSKEESGKPGGKEDAKAKTAGAKQSSHPDKNAKGKATLTDKEDSISYDDEMSVQQELNGSNELLLKVKSNRTAYLRMYAFDTFDGFSWKASDQEANIVEKPQRGDIKVDQQPSLQLPSNYPAVELMQDYSVEHDLSRNIPVTWVPKALSPNLKNISVDNYGAIRLQDGDLKKGTQFKVVSSFPIYNLSAMREEQPLTAGDQEQLRSRMPQFLQLPDQASDQTEHLAEQLTAELPDNWFSKTDALTQYLRKNYRYSTPKFDSENPLEDFLFVRKTGDCKDFATALTMLTRSVGIPSRVVAGYAPGDFNSLSGAREVRAKHRHVWTEVYIPKYGWVPFDSTPSGYMPGKPREKSYDMVALQESMQSADVSRSPNDETLRKKRHIITPLDIVTWAVDALAAGAIGFFVIRAVRNAMQKRRQENERAHPARKFLKRVEAALKKWKIEKQPAETGAELGARVRSVVAERRRLALPHSTEVPTMVEEFMEHYYAAYFGNKNRTHDLEELSHQITVTIGKTTGGDSKSAAPVKKMQAAKGNDSDVGDASAAIRPKRGPK